MANLTEYIIRFIGETQGIDTTTQQVKHLDQSFKTLNVDTSKMSKVISTDVVSSFDKNDFSLYVTSS